MRLGCYGNYGAALNGTVDKASSLDRMIETLDTYGLSAVTSVVENNTDEECVALRERAAKLGIVLSENCMWENLMTDDQEAQGRRIALVRAMLKKADLAGVKCVVTIAGTKSTTSHDAPHPANYTKEFRREFREVVLRILDGLDLKTTGYGVEPWHNCFFYQPEDIREFIDSVGHPRFGLHLDQMNMMSQKDFFNTTGLINRTFDLLADKVFSVHLKDIAFANHMFMKLDEVHIGDGFLDYGTYLKRLSKLPPDTPCSCEHFNTLGDYAICYARLHHLAKKNGVHFLRRGE